MTSPSLRLVFLITNQRWAFTLGDQLIRLDNPSEAMFWIDRKNAVFAAQERGIWVDENGGCYTSEEKFA